MKSFLLLFLILAGNTYAQVNINWHNIYNGPDTLMDRSISMARDNSGNIYIVGNSRNQTTDTDILTLKYNAAGVFQWARTYNGTDSSSDAATDIDVDAMGNVYVTGNVRNTNIDAVLIKYNTNGALEWVKTHTGSGNGVDYFNKVFVGQDGNIYAVGSSKNTNTDLSAVKYSASGTLLWQAVYNVGSANEEGVELTVGDSGNVYVAGSTASTGSTYVDMLTVKINSNGIIQWGKTFAGVGSAVDDANSVTTGDSGNVYVTGSSYSGTGTNYDVTTIKYNLNGTAMWTKKYISPGYQTAEQILKGDSGNVYVLASTGDYTLIKYDRDGNEEWVSHYNGPQDYLDQPMKMRRDSHGNFYLTGYTEDTTAADGSFYSHTATVKIDPNGSLIWSIVDTAYSIANDITCDNNGNIFVTGDLYGAAVTRIQHFAYSSSVGINQVSTETPAGFSLFQNFPNPFNPTTIIKFEIPKASFVRLAVYDITGREAAVLVNNNLNAGKYEYSFEGSSHSGGVYFYRLITESFSATKKMVIVK